MYIFFWISNLLVGNYGNTLIYSWVNVVEMGSMIGVSDRPGWEQSNKGTMSSIEYTFVVLMRKGCFNILDIG